MKLLIFPKDANPYQDLLYKQLSGRIDAQYLHWSVRGRLGLLVFMPLLFGNLIIYRARGFRMIHIHWVYPLYAPKKLPFHSRVTNVQILAFFAALRILNYKIIWTVHNVVPQIPQTHDDERLMRILSKISSAKIVHSDHVIKDMDSHQLDITNTTTIPHGNYIGTYPQTTTAIEARVKLGLRINEFIILFFGNVSAYKGLEDLLNVITEINQPCLRLVIAGHCTDERLRHVINSAAKATNIDFHDGHVPDDVVQIYFQACDVVCLPFKAITTSGSAILALSFGKPIVAPRLGALNDLPEGIGYFYDPEAADALEKAILAAIDNREGLRVMGENASKYAASISWDQVADSTYQVYKVVLGLQELHHE
jgi:beta-1,4-mannosyltransferase